MEYIVYMRTGGIMEQPHFSNDFVKFITAESKDEAFDKWLTALGFDKKEFRKEREGLWWNYYPVYCKELAETKGGE